MRTLAFALLIAVPAIAQQFRPERHAPWPPSIWRFAVNDVAVGDADGDGLDDMFLAHDQGGVVHLRADGYGGFQDVTTAVLRPAYASAFGVSLGDADNDGDLDLVAVHDRTGHVQVCMNQGNGTFVDVTASFAPTRTRTPISVTWIDIDNDRLLDVCVGEVGQTGLRLFAQRNGVLNDVTTTHLPSSAVAPAWRMQTVDLDADGDQDLIFVASAPNLLINDGTGRFTQPPAASFPTSFDVIGSGDFDGDGLVDLVVRTMGPNGLWFQNQGGTFVDRTSTHFAGIATSMRLHSADVDLDGDLDLCSIDRLLVNDGTGRFTDATVGRWTSLLPHNSYTGPAMAMGDVDGDGDPDALVADWTSRQMASINHHVQVSTPSAPVRGASYRIDYEASPGYATGPMSALPWFGSAPFALQLPPFGRIGIDPATMITGPVFSIAAPAGRATLQLPVPADPNLQGLEIYLQAVLVDPAGNPTLTNAVRDLVR